MGKQFLCRTIGLYILKDTGLGFSFYLWDSLTQELLLGMNGIETNCGAKLSPMIPSSRNSIGIGATGSSS
jgi:hypothetical protein